MRRSHMAQRGLSLCLDERLVLLDGEDRPSSVRNLPHDDRRYVHRVSVKVVDLEFVRLEIVDLHGNPLAVRKRRDQHQTGPPDGSDVLAEELANTGFTRRNDVKTCAEQADDDHPDRPYGYLDCPRDHNAIGRINGADDDQVDETRQRGK